MQRLVRSARRRLAAVVALVSLVLVVLLFVVLPEALGDSPYNVLGH